MAQKLTDRAALDPLLANGWALVDGRDALEKKPTPSPISSTPSAG